jgi:hypothetical protein
VTRPCVEEEQGCGRQHDKIDTLDSSEGNSGSLLWAVVQHGSCCFWLPLLCLEALKSRGHWILLLRNASGPRWSARAATELAVGPCLFGLPATSELSDWHETTLDPCQSVASET